MRFDLIVMGMFLGGLVVTAAVEGVIAIVGHRIDRRSVADQRRWNRIEALVAEFYQAQT